jgi:hypothetical protein
LARWGGSAVICAMSCERNIGAASCGTSARQLNSAISASTATANAARM